MKKYLLTYALVLGSLYALAQQGFVAVAGDAASGTGSVSYSVGQIDYQVYGNTSHFIIEGLQQPIDLAVVPVSLLYFTATKGTNKTVNLNWSTVSEFNNDSFKIERSNDAIHFETIKTVASAGNSQTRVNYAAVDLHPFNGYNYYRLKQIDKDGRQTLTAIERIYFDTNDFTATVWPNPTKDVVQVKINGSDIKNCRYQLFDMNGKIVAKGIMNSPAVSINLKNNPQATYILQIIKAGKMLQSFKIIKNN